MKKRVTFLSIIVFMSAMYGAFAQERATSNSSTQKKQDELMKVNYQPVHLIANIGKTDENTYTNFGIELNASRRLINYVNYGVGLAYYRFEWSNNGGFDNVPYPYVATQSNSFEPSAFLSAYLPLNKVLGNADRSSVGFFPYVSAGAFFRSSSINTDTRTSTTSGTTSSADSATDFGFYNIVGVDYKFKKSIGLSLATQKFNSFWFGVNFQF